MSCGTEDRVFQNTSTLSSRGLTRIEIPRMCREVTPSAQKCTITKTGKGSEKGRDQTGCGNKPPAYALPIGIDRASAKCHKSSTSK